MKIGFFGTPHIAAFCLNNLLLSHHVTFIVTGEDKPAGRNRKIQINPVKTIAIDKAIPIFQPKNLKDKHFYDEIAVKDAEVFIVVAYGKIIPPEIFNMPRHGAINLHPSLLPKYRGAAPIQWSLIKGENETGITVQQISEKLDAGDILFQKQIKLDYNMTAEDLYNIVLPTGSDLLVQTLESLNNGSAIPIRQDENKATFCNKIDRETARIDWNEKSFDIHNLIRGLNPRPVAWTTLKGKNIKIYKTKPIESSESIKLAPGHIEKINKKLLVGTREGCLEILEIQPETKKKMDGISFLNGYRIVKGDRFDS